MEVADGLFLTGAYEEQRKECIVKQGIRYAVSNKREETTLLLLKSLLSLSSASLHCNLPIPLKLRLVFHC